MFQAKTVNHIEKRAYWGVFPKNTGFYWSADEPGLQQRQYGSIRKSNNLDPLLKVWLFWDESGMCVLLTDLHGELGTYVMIRIHGLFMWGCFSYLRPQIIEQGYFAWVQVANLYFNLPNNHVDRTFCKTID